MPFLTLDAEGREVLLFCSREAGLWKVFYRIGGVEPSRLDTRLPAEAVECSPSAWQDDAGWHVTVVAGGVPADRRFRLYRLDGPALDALHPPVAIVATAAGFVYRDRLVYAEPESLVHVRGGGLDRVLELPGAKIYRVSYRSDAPEVLLVSGQWDGESEPFTVEHDLATGEQQSLVCDGQPGYKATIAGDRVLYAARTGEGFEDRTIREAHSIERTPTWAIRTRWPTDDWAATSTARAACSCDAPVAESLRQPTRPSCLDCVEKHLGAAYCLLAETVDGYAHRLRAVGHLYEAQDESQEFITLHDAIRQARRAFQAHETMPDWPRIAALIEEARHAR
jgi:hypothetical protein